MSTEQRLESTTTKGAPVVEGLPEEANDTMETQENDRDRDTLTTVNILRMHRSGRSIPVKIRTSTNQIRVMSVSAHVPRE